MMAPTQPDGTGKPVTVTRTTASAASSPPASSHDSGAASISSTSPASSPPMPTCQAPPNTANGTQVSTPCTSSASHRWRDSNGRVPGTAYNSGTTNSATVNGTWLLCPELRTSDTLVTSSRHRTATGNARAPPAASASEPDHAHHYDPGLYTRQASQR